MRGFYAICDTVTLARKGFDPIGFARAVLPSRPCAFQLRAKDLSCDTMVSLLRALVPHARAHGVPLYANDRADVAALSGADGVHLGQTDMAIDVAKMIAPGLAIGLSTHNVSQLDVALTKKPAYVAMGPIFSTRSKENPDPEVGLAGLRVARAAATRAGISLVAIGGITLFSSNEVAEIADAIAVIADLTHDANTLEDVADRARKYAEIAHAHDKHPLGNAS